MPAPDRTPLYRHTDVALVRAAAKPLTQAPSRWPDLADADGCRVWLAQVWSRPDLADAVRQASVSLGERVDAILNGHTVTDKQVRSVSMSIARYLLRAHGRPTPFGLFAGVAPASWGPTTLVRWGEGHRAAARVDTGWLAEVIARAEGCPELLDRLDVVANDLAVPRGGRLEIPRGANRVSIRYTPVVAAVRVAAVTPVRFGGLVESLAEDFAADRVKVTGALTELVRQGYLLTSLRAPFTITDPLTYLVDRLHAAGAASIDAGLVAELDAIWAALRRHNHARITKAEQSRLRAALTRRMTRLSPAERTPLAVDLRLDCRVRLPEHVAREMELAASALLRLTRQPAGEPAWRDYRTMFAERYGTGTLVPLTEVIDPDAGLGYPAGYRGSVLPEPAPAVTQRDERLLALAWQALADGSREIVLTDELIGQLTGEAFDERYIPPHVELSARVQAVSTMALERGDYTLIVAPARSAGTLTSRFTPMAIGSGLGGTYRSLPAATDGALRVQMSFGPLYPHAENICRVPAYLDHLLPLGEHRGSSSIPGDDETRLAVNDLAITATHDRLHLVSITRRRVVEPQVFHALALDKQPAPLARFLAQLPRAFSAAWYQFGWGPAADLPFLPRVRYHRTILWPARWRLSADDLPPRGTNPGAWRNLLDQWRRQWGCPDVVELRDADRTLRLTLDLPAHATLLHAHLTRHGQAILYEVTPVGGFGWIDGHAHEIAVPLVTARPAAPSPVPGPLLMVTNTHGHLPGGPDTTWLSVKIPTHPERMNEIISDHLPELLAELGAGSSCWWIRYRSHPRVTDHLRLRVRTEPESYAESLHVVGTWTQRLQEAGLAAGLAVDTYRPEIGRYGPGKAMDAAEDVFAADSHLVALALRNLTAVHPTALVVANMVGIISGFLGGLAEAMDWLAARPVPSTPATDRAVTEQAIRLATTPAQARELHSWTTALDQAWQTRADRLATYHEHLPAGASIGAVLESLLHMHHNRAVGIDPQGERTCRRLARQAALAWQARSQDDQPR
jgi:lantibiotic biosynthesis protein